MTLLVTREALGIVAGGSSSSIAEDDELATLAIQLASETVADASGHPEWVDGDVDLADIPRTAKRVAFAVAHRTYTNFEGVVASSIGPISERLREEMAYSMTLTEAEEDKLGDLAPGGDPDNGLVVVRLHPGAPAGERTVFVTDDQQVNIAPDEEWKIPYLDVDSTPAGAIAMTPPEAP